MMEQTWKLLSSRKYLMEQPQLDSEIHRPDPIPSKANFVRGIAHFCLFRKMEDRFHAHSILSKPPGRS